MKVTILALSLMAASPAAHALEAKVRLACTGDYFRYCSNTWPGSEASKQCFRATGKNLSRRCKNALRISIEFRSDYFSQVKRGGR